MRQFFLLLTLFAASWLSAQDVTPPVAICKDATIAITEFGFTDPIDPASIDGGSYDEESGVALLEVNVQDFSCDAIWEENIVTLTVTDNEGNSSTCDAVITIIDTLAPVEVFCQDLQVEINDNGVAIIESWELELGSSDNCGIAYSEASKTEFSCADLGENLVDVVFYDFSGNSASCQSIVTVSDPRPSVAICLHGSVNVYLTDGAGSISLQDINDGYTTCNILSSTLSQSDFSCTDIGVVPVILEVEDVQHNVSSCSTDIYVFDDNDFVNAVCKDVTVSLVDGSAGITFEDVDGGSNAYCGFTADVNPAAFGINDIGDNTVTVTLTTASGIVSTCQATVTVEDNVTAPEAVCQDITVDLGSDGTAAITAEDIDGGSSDANGIASLEASVLNFDCSQVGANTVILTVTNINDLSASCEAVVTVADVTAPDALCADITIQLDAEGNAAITAQDIDGGSSDACGVADLSADLTAFTCAEIGENPVTLTVSDDHGNSSSCTAIVNVEDAEAPTAVCADISVALVEGQAEITADDVNNSYDNCGIATAEVSASTFTCNNIGINPVTLTVTDVNGNTATCTANVEVIGSIPTVSIQKSEMPEFCQGDQVVLTATSNDAVDYQWSVSDGSRSIVSNGDLPRMAFVFETGIYKVTATNVYGCSAEATIKVDYDKTKLASTYTVLAKTEAAFKKNTIGSGGIGLLTTTGKAVLESNTMVTAAGTYVKANKIDIKSGSIVTDKKTGTAQVTLPAFFANPYSSSKNDITVADNAVVTLSGTTYGNVTIGKNAKVTFSSPILYMKSYTAKDGSTVNFASCTKMTVSNTLVVGKNTATNPGQQKLIIYNDKVLSTPVFTISEGSVFNGNLYLLNGTLKANAARVDKPIRMNGMFIVDKLDADDYTVWNQNTACDPACNAPAPAPVPAQSARLAEQPAAEQKAIVEQVVLEAAPNPFSLATTIRFAVPESGNAKLVIYSATGQTIGTLFDGNAEAGKTYQVRFDATRTTPGLYFYRIETASGKVQVNKLIITR